MTAFLLCDSTDGERKREAFLRDGGSASSVCNAGLLDVIADEESNGHGVKKRYIWIR